jgi:predicted ferric reductase
MLNQKRGAGGGMRKRVVYGTLWVIVYLILILSPLFLILIGPTPPGRGFWRDFSVALGFAGLAMIGFQFLLTARFRRVTSPYGVDVLYHFHRQISIMAFFLILAHPLILFVSDPATIRLLNIITAPWRAQAGVISLLALLALIVTSVWRMPLRISYEGWRLTHSLLSIAAVALGIAHVVGIGYYVGTLWKMSLWVALGLGWIGALLYVRIFKPARMLKRPYVVEEVIQERGRTWTLVLRPDGHPGLRFMPGQFAWLTMWSSPYAIREHPFSFSSSAVTQERLHLSIKELGDFTSRIGEVTPGTVAYLDGPYGAFTIDIHPASGYVFVAGGIGITPIISMLRTMAERRDTRPALLFYASKTWEQTTFREEIEELQGRMNLRVVYVLENPEEGWEGESGFINAKMMVKYLPEDRENLEFFICGPPPMMNVVEDVLFRLGLPIERSHTERFNLV